MARFPFYIVDVFAESRYAGNQLAVFRSGDTLTATEMQKIAQEMNYSETTFLLSEQERDGGFDVRIFTPGEELPFAGHPTLGTAHILCTEILPLGAANVTLNLKAGQIPVTFTGGKETETVYWMKQIEPTFGETLDAQIVAPVLGLAPDEIDARFPIEQVSTGLPHILVPLKTLDALKRAKVVKDKYWELVEKTWAKPVMIFCPQPHKPENHLSVRMFADCFGIPEDPATGSGQGCLAAYLAHHRYWGEAKIDARSEQGYEIGRPSLLFLKAEEKNGHIGVEVGGQAVTIAKGEFV